jgi:hypothetical protein
MGRESAIRSRIATAAKGRLAMTAHRAPWRWAGPSQNPPHAGTLTSSAR